MAWPTSTAEQRLAQINNRIEKIEELCVTALARAEDCPDHDEDAGGSVQAHENYLRDALQRLTNAKNEMDFCIGALEHGGGGA